MDDCIFCKIIRGEIPSTKIYEDGDAFAFLDIAPVNVGHTLVVPKQHFKNVYETPDEVLQKVMTAAKKIAEALKALPSDGVNVTINNDSAAGQVVFHFHVHVIPRIAGDGFPLWHSRRPYNEGEAKGTAEKIMRGL
ncbi:MAG: HIT domain-containing protein [Patescibacteria group bacterium]